MHRSPFPPPSPDGFQGIPKYGSEYARGDYKPAVMTDPPPKFRTVGFRVPPDRMVDGLLSGIVGAGMQVRLVDRDERVITAMDEMPDGKRALVTLSVDDAGSSCRVRLVYDRPPGTKMDPRSDDLRLGALLSSTEEGLPGVMGR